MIQRFRPPSMRQQLTGLLLILVLAFVGLTNGMAQSPNGPDAKDKPVPQSEDQPIEKEGAQAETIRVSGTCRDFEGNTVAEADVRVFRRLRPFGKIKTVFQTRTDEFGQFEIELTAVDLVGESGEENGALAIRSDQHVSQLRFLNPDYPAEDLEITLFPRGGLLSGKVLRPDGQPQAGVWVYFPNALGAPVPDMQSAITDDAGEFQIADGPVPKADVEVLRANEEEAEGFESFDLLRPNDEREVCLVVTRWRSEDDFRAWLNSPDFAAGHSQHREQGPVGTSSEIWSFDVLESITAD